MIDYSPRYSQMRKLRILIVIELNCYGTPEQRFLNPLYQCGLLELVLSFSMSTIEFSLDRLKRE